LPVAGSVRASRPAGRPPLIRALQAPAKNKRNFDDCAAAAEALGQVAPGTPDATDAIAALASELAKTADARLSEAARKALSAIEKAR
jgi:hypothetical protein